MNYKSAGVDIEHGNKVKSNIQNIAKRATRPEVLSKIGGFGGLFKLDTSKYKNPVLVSSTDGVGSKLKLAKFLFIIFNTQRKSDAFDSGHRCNSTIDIAFCNKTQ